MKHPVIPLLIITTLYSCFQNEKNSYVENIDNDLFQVVNEGRISMDAGLSRGLAWGDYDNDGDSDLYVANSNGQWNFLYRNEGNGNFKKITSESIKASETVIHGGNSQGVNWVDYDNDNDLDLYVVSRSEEPNLLFRNDSILGFKRILNHPLASEGISASVACWADFDNNGFLDVFLAGYSDKNRLFMNTGNGWFEEINKSIVTSNKEGRARACVCGDANNDGRTDLYVANARQENEMYINEGGWRFRKHANSHEQNNIGYSYGASWADYDNDGDLDLFVANFDRENFLYKNNGSGIFTPLTNDEVTTENGGASKGHAWGDFDNDGDLDLFIANGTYAPDMRNFLFLNRGDGTFYKHNSRVFETYADTSAGAAISDYDLDGDLDVFVANWGSKDQVNRLYQNLNQTGNWLVLKLRGGESNSYGLGSKVTLHVSNVSTKARKTLYRWQYPVTGFASQNDQEVHFGFNTFDQIDSLVIDWPSGIRDIHLDLETNKRYVFFESRKE